MRQSSPVRLRTGAAEDIGPVRHASPPDLTLVKCLPRDDALPAEAPALASATREPRVAVVHDWCPAFRGGERVLARICAQFPGAEVFTLLDLLPDEVKEQYFRGVNFHPSPLNRLPLVRRFYRSLFFLCPILIEQFDVTGYDAVISSSAAFARGVITRPDQPHLCYVHSPVRYAWDEQFSYFQQGRIGFGPRGLLYRYLMHRLRMWDARTAHGPDLMLANSSFVQARIRHIYGRDAHVVHPPVALDELRFVEDKDDYYVCAAYHAPYKRTDLVIRAFAQMPTRRLIVVGEVLSPNLRALAGPNVAFAGFLPRQDYVRTVARARAMVFAGCEDFGIALAEAQACGTPLIAYGRGGVTDIVRPLPADRPTGVLFARQSVEAVRDAVELFEKHRRRIAPHACRDNAARFSEQRFDEAIREALATVRALHGV
jgi:glycosyltransferase involved in cell wall biosynthesis